MFLPAGLAARVGVPQGDVLVRPVFDKADLVCMCRVEMVSVAMPGIDGSGSQRAVRVNAEILDGYKSPPEAQGGLVEFEYPIDPMSTESGIQTKQILLIFLKLRPSGIYQLADPTIGLTIFRQQPRVSDFIGFDGLQSALAATLGMGNSEDQINALYLLKGIQKLDPNTLSAVSELSSSRTPDVAFVSLAVLLATGTPESVNKLKNYLDGYQEVRPPVGLISAAGALSLITDVNTLPDLEDLSGSRLLSIQRAAMNAIRKIASTKSVPVLIQRLDDPDPNVQYSAVITLAELLGADGDYGPDMGLFDKDPHKYVALWKQRWAEQPDGPTP
jgi:hypothetical protein